MIYEVILIGGGPVGMILAGELALAGVKVCVIERLKETNSIFTCAYRPSTNP